MTQPSQPMTEERFGAWIKARRIAAGLGLREFAALIGENGPNVCAIEKGTRKRWQSDDRLRRVAEVLGIVEGSGDWWILFGRSRDALAREVDRLKSELADQRKQIEILKHAPQTLLDGMEVIGKKVETLVAERDAALAELAAIDKVLVGRPIKPDSPETLCEEFLLKPGGRAEFILAGQEELQDAWKREEKLEAELALALAGEAVMREAMEKCSRQNVYNPPQWDSICVECHASNHAEGCKIGQALDGTAASALLAELRQLRERVREMEGRQFRDEAVPLR